MHVRGDLSRAIRFLQDRQRRAGPRRPAGKPVSFGGVEEDLAVGGLKSERAVEVAKSIVGVSSGEVGFCVKMPAASRLGSG